MNVYETVTQLAKRNLILNQGFSYRPTVSSLQVTQSASKNTERKECVLIRVHVKEKVTVNQQSVFTRWRSREAVIDHGQKGWDKILIAYTFPA